MSDLRNVHDDTFTVPYKEIVLDRLKYGVQAAISNAVLEVEQDWLTDSMILRLKGEVLAEKLPPVSKTATTTVPFFRPATWWQAWKDEHSEKWYARWLVNWRPVKLIEESAKVTLTVDLQRYRTYPEATFELPRDRYGSPVRVAAVSHSWQVT